MTPVTKQCLAANFEHIHLFIETDLGDVGGDSGEYALGFRRERLLAICLIIICSINTHPGHNYNTITVCSQHTRMCIGV